MKLLSKIALAALAVSLVQAAPASAEEGPIASARAVDAQIREYLDSATAPLPAAPDGAAAVAEAPAPDRAPHGEVGVGIGSNGYRHAHASTIVPVGDIGTAAIAVSDTRFNGRFGPRKQQSLSIGVALGEAAGQPPAPDCSEQRLARGEPEPLWVTRMRTGQAGAGLACGPGTRR